MAFAEWSEQFSVGVEKIDRDHKRLLALLNELHDALKAGDAHDVTSKVLDGMVSYVDYHFAHEEALFLRTGYPGYERHHRQHRALTVTVSEIHADFNAGTLETLPEQVLEFLKTWLYEHILGSDRAFGMYFNAWRAKNPGVVLSEDGRELEPQ